MISFCKSFELKHSSGCLDTRLLEPDRLEVRLLISSIGPTIGVRPKSLDKSARLTAQLNTGFWCAGDLISLYERLKFEISLFDSMCSIEEIKRSHVHTWLSSNALVELFVLNGTRTFKLTTFADKRLSGSKDAHYTLDRVDEDLLLEALRELRDMTRRFFAQLDGRSLSASKSSRGKPAASPVTGSGAEGPIQPVVALGPNGRRRSRKIEPSSVSVPTWPLKVSSSDQDGF